MNWPDFEDIFQLLKTIFSRIKPYLRWLILGGTLFFLAKTLKDHAQEVASLKIAGSGWAFLGLSLGVTLLAHIWSGWVWTWILREFNQPVPLMWALRVYLKTNIAKYLPGNVWHFYGRISAISEKGVSLSLASLSVLLEPLLMAAAALMIALISTQGVWHSTGIWQSLGLAGVLLGVHPRILNPVVKFVGKLKFKKNVKNLEDLPGEPLENSTLPKLERYPVLPLLGEVGFLLLRGSGFLFTIVAMTPTESLPTTFLSQVPELLGAFSFAWLLGLVVPGAPGGIGVFEATAIALLDHQFSPAVLLGAIAFYRLISVIAEAAGAAIAL